MSFAYKYRGGGPLSLSIVCHTIIINLNLKHKAFEIFFCCSLNSYNFPFLETTVLVHIEVIMGALDHLSDLFDCSTGRSRVKRRKQLQVNISKHF